MPFGVLLVSIQHLKKKNIEKTGLGVWQIKSYYNAKEGVNINEIYNGRVEVQSRTAVFEAKQWVVNFFSSS